MFKVMDVHCRHIYSALHSLKFCPTKSLSMLPDPVGQVESFPTSQTLRIIPVGKSHGSG